MDRVCRGEHKIRRFWGPVYDPSSRRCHGFQLRLGHDTLPDSDYQEFVPYEARVISAHPHARRYVCPTPRRLRGAASKALIAGAGGAATCTRHVGRQNILACAGRARAQSPLTGVDSLHSIVQNAARSVPWPPCHRPADAANAALFALAMLAVGDSALRNKLEQFRARQTEAARAMTLPPAGAGA